jgi:sugar lactone lactonase YvrE
VAGGGTFKDGPGSIARFSLPEGITNDSAGNLYVSDFTNGRIRKINSAGIVSTFSTAASGPRGITIDGSNNFVVADNSSHQIKKIDMSGNVILTVGSSNGYVDAQGTNAKFSSPNSVVLDGSNNIYLTENHRVRKIDASGNVTTIAGLASGTGNADLQGTNASFNNPWGITRDVSGNLYVADFSNNKIRKISPSGNVTTFVGSTAGFVDGQGTNAKLSGPSGLYTDSTGNIYVTENNNFRIRKIDTAANVTTIAGWDGGFADGIGTNAKFNQPVAITMDSSGNLYVAEQGPNNRIRKISP